VGRDFLGRINIPLRHLFHAKAALLFSDPDNKPKWHTLMKRSKKSNVAGELLLKIGFNQNLDMEKFASLLEKPCRWTVIDESINQPQPVSFYLRALSRWGSGRQ
jgi:hypothetical protein